MSIQFLLKFGKLEHLDQLLHLGRIYINPAKFFAQNIPHPRHDPNEGKISITHLKDTFIDIRPAGTSEWKKLNVKTGNWDYSLKLDRFYIYSMFSILESETRQNQLFEFSEEIKQMGEGYLLISNPREFVSRMTNELDKQGYTYTYGIVEYYNPLEDQEKLGLFHKQDDYRFQKEFRIAVELKETDNIQQVHHIQIDIGSLADIAEVCTNDQHKGLRFLWQ